jgi:hypothetical protein
VPPTPTTPGTWLRPSSPPKRKARKQPRLAFVDVLLPEIGQRENRAFRGEYRNGILATD